MGIRLIAFDLDGTLLKDDKTISETTVETLREVAEKGIVLVPATGRLFDRMPQELRDLPFIRYAITVNGAEVYDREQERSIYRAELGWEETLSLFDYLDTLPVIYDVYQDGLGMMDRDSYDRIPEKVPNAFLASLIRKNHSPVDSIRKLVEENKRPVMKVQFFTENAKLRLDQIEYMRKIYPQYAITASLPCNLEINAAGADKGMALAALCAYLNIPLAECMALGDGNNDAGMLRTAGLGVAMGNADAEARAAADVLTDTNEKNGLAKAIRRYALDA